MAVELDETAFPPFAVTPAAIDAIVSLGGAVRVTLEAGGCCGTAYAFHLADPVHPDADSADDVYGCPGAWLVVSPGAGDVLTGATLDYSARLKPPRFRVLNNPNTEQVCPCKRSFGNSWPGPRQPTCRSYLPMPWDTTYQAPQAWRRQTGYPDAGDAERH